MKKINKYSIRRVELDKKWDEFILSSPNGSFFMMSEYINLLNLKFHAYFCLKSEEIMGAILCIISEDERDVIGHDLIIYDGLVYRDLSYLNKSQKHSEEFSIQESVAEELAKRYNSINITLHPSILDIRAFLWFDFKNKKNNYNLDVRYTSVIELKEFNTNIPLEDLSLYKNASVARRQEIRYAIKKGNIFRENKDIKKFLDFYILTMRRQNIEVKDSKILEMDKLLTGLMKIKKIKIVQSANSEQRTGSMAVFVIYKNIAYYLFGASDPEMRNEHTGTNVIWESLTLLSEYDIIKLDMEGINSPQRGWFKLSFGGDIFPYFRLNFTKNNS